MKILLIFILLFSGCGLYHNSYKPDVLLEKKINQSRKSQIIKDGKTDVIAIATYLNNVDSTIYNGDREYFYLEIFSELEIPLLESMHFWLSGGVDFLWIREIEKDESDKIITPNNKWSRGFLIAFDVLEYQQKKNMILRLDIDNIGSMKFDFTYKVLEMQL